MPQLTCDRLEKKRVKDIKKFGQTTCDGQTELTLRIFNSVPRLLFYCKLFYEPIFIINEFSSVICAPKTNSIQCKVYQPISLVCVS